MIPIPSHSLIYNPFIPRTNLAAQQQQPPHPKSSQNTLKPTQMYNPYTPHIPHIPLFSENDFLTTYPDPHALNRDSIIETWEYLLSAPYSYFQTLYTRLYSAIKAQLISPDSVSKLIFVEQLQAEHEAKPHVLFFQEKGSLVLRMCEFLEVLASLKRLEEALNRREREKKASPVPSAPKPAQRLPGEGTQILNDLGQKALQALVNQAGAQGSGGQAPQNQNHQPPPSVAMQQPQYLPAPGYNYPPPPAPAGHNPYAYPPNHFPPPGPYPYPYPYALQNPGGPPTVQSPQKSLPASQPARAQSPEPKPIPTMPRHFPARYPSKDPTEVGSVTSNQRKDGNAKVSAARNRNANKKKGR
ncbi:hypothetical protein B7494_g4858 [Chlorociboria aeruginascens]|nr:hypothetical protein B7494_g4858 [Chlorociboria aeruginascens]